LDEAATDNPSRDFEAQPRRTQIGQMRGLAHAALQAYNHPPYRLTLIAHLYNTTFRVDTETDERYVLRIHRAWEHSFETIRSELLWLAALRRDTPLQVPDPVTTRAGDLLTEASIPGVPVAFKCVLFCWLPGRRYRRGLTPRHMLRVGELLGRLQNHASGWELPPGFTRQRVDHPLTASRRGEPFADETIAYVEDLVADNLSKDEAAIVGEVLRQARDVEREMGEGPEAFGLMHADLHYGNLLYEGDAVKAIDFDDCGFGNLLYDMSPMLNEIDERPNYAALRAAMLEGYRRVRPLSAEHEAHIDTFIALRRVQDAVWGFEVKEHTTLGENYKEEVRRALTALPRLLSA
jgi:Ser/Thr protein kinase RdoA (MazF antagonist)